MRPRERYLHCGPDDVGNAEILALILGTGAGGRTAMSIAVELLERFHGLNGLARAHPSELSAVVGVGDARAIRIHAGLHAGRRSVRQPHQAASPVLSPDQAWEHLGPPLAGLGDEELHALYLDRRQKPLARRMLTRGSDSLTVVDPRQVLRPAVSLGAAGVILAHNHPSGDPTPSRQDREVTLRVSSAGRVVGVSLLDHLVIAGKRYRSLAEDGLLPAWERPRAFAAADRPG